MALIILFSLIFILPYVLYFKKRYKESRNKKLFLHENLYRSVAWILLLIIVPIIFVNSFIDPGQEAVEELVVEDLKNALSNLEMERNDNKDNLDFHFSYINTFADDYYNKKWHTKSVGTEMVEFYEGLAEEGFTDISFWARGYFYSLSGNTDSAFYFLGKVEDNELKYLNYAFATTYFRLDSMQSYIDHLIAEVSSDRGAKEEAFPALIHELVEQNNMQQLRTMMDISESEIYMDYTLRRKVLFLNYEFINYYGQVFSWFTQSINPAGILAALLILAVWTAYMVKLAFFEQIKWDIIACVLGLGMIFCFLTFLLSDTLEFVFGIWEEYYSIWDVFTYSVFGIGAVEELVKIIPLLIILLFVKQKLQPYEYILLASVSALGFAFMENLLYFKGTYGSIIHGRALTAAVGHMVDSSIFAYGIVLSKFKYKKMHAVGAFFVFWFLAALAHGLYDYWLFIELFVFFVLYFFLLIRVWITILNNTINNSDNFKYTRQFKTSNLQFYLAFSLTAILIFEYVVVAFMEGSVSANDSLISSAFTGSFLIMFLGSKLSSLNLIKGYWAKINYSINPFTDDIVSQNFVGQKVYLSSYYPDRGLVEYFPDGVVGIIVNRMVLQNRLPTFFMSNDDSEWFSVKLAKPFGIEGYVQNYALIKFKEKQSSLNDRKFFHVQLLMVPKELPSPKHMRKNFESLGWVFLEDESSAKEAS